VHHAAGPEESLLALDLDRCAPRVVEVQLVLLVVGGKGGYVERDGHMVDDADVERRRSFGAGG
jgi:hypothetical protein